MPAPGVRFVPKEDLIPTPNGAMLLVSVTEPTSMTMEDQVNATAAFKRVPCELVGITDS